MLRSALELKSHHLLAALAFAALAAVGGACSSTPSDTSSRNHASGGTDNPDATGFGGTSGTGATGGVVFNDSGPGIHNDFANPIIDPAAPANAPDLFVQPGQPSGGPCLYEPELGAMFPHNWLRPRFRFTASPGENLFEIKLVIPNETSPLVVYTTQPTWTMDTAVWNIIRDVAAGGTIQVSMRSAIFSGGVLTTGPNLGSTGTLDIAPVDAPGSVVYWTTSGGTVFKGFAIGDESVVDVLKPPQATAKCVGCHSSTPDGKLAGISASDDPGDGTPARIELRAVDGTAQEPTFLSGNAKALLARKLQEAPVFSKAHWMDGDRVSVSMLPLNSKSEMIWTDLAATSQDQGAGWGIIQRQGDAQSAASASFSHDGTFLVYVSAPSVGAGVIVPDGGDLYRVPYNNRAGGPVTPIAGASDPAFNEYYPILSPDDLFVAYDRAPPGNTSYNDPQSEVFVIPTTGGTPLRIKANDPPACIGLTSPGITNSWPKWAPERKSAGGKDYYFLVFSSVRDIGKSPPGPQLYVTAITVEGGTLTTYSALYLWNQPEADNNHTPAWDTFQLAPPQ